MNPQHIYKPENRAISQAVNQEVYNQQITARKVRYRPTHSMIRMALEDGALAWWN
jgi:hypothetical protein